MKSFSTQPEPASKGRGSLEGWLSKLSWGVAVLMIALMGYVIFQRVSSVSSQAEPGSQAEAAVIPAQSAAAALPVFQPATGIDAILRDTTLRTIIPTRPREEVITYKVDKGDSVFGIAQKFNLKPETVLWANYDTLNDDPHTIEVGLDLLIPATNGVLYKWNEGDTIENVASSLKAESQDILLWPGNHLDMINPVIEPGTLVMVPDGQREFRTWVVPTIPRGKAGVNKSIYGPGACETGDSGAYGTGTFVWPAPTHALSGNDYWPGHLAIDIATASGDPIYATDSGLVVYAGPIGGGYGNMVMIDHGNGYQSLYAHLTTWKANCGQSVYQGQLIGLAGSTGNSTGPHLHFEVRYLGGFINPWYVLP